MILRQLRPSSDATNLSSPCFNSPLPSWQTLRYPWSLYCRQRFVMIIDCSYTYIDLLLKIGWLAIHNSL